MSRWPDDYVRTPIDRLDLQSGDVLYAAQADALRRGRYAPRSDLVLLHATRSSRLIAEALSIDIRADQTSIETAVDAEWSDQADVADEPRDVIRQAVFAAEARIAPASPIELAGLVAQLLRFEHSRASRVVRALGGDPATVADRLERKE